MITTTMVGIMTLFTATLPERSLTTTLTVILLMDIPHHTNTHPVVTVDTTAHFQRMTTVGTPAPVTLTIHPIKPFQQPQASWNESEASYHLLWAEHPRTSTKNDRIVTMSHTVSAMDHILPISDLQLNTIQ